MRSAVRTRLLPCFAVVGALVCWSRLLHLGVGAGAVGVCSLCTAELALCVPYLGTRRRMRACSAPFAPRLPYSPVCMFMLGRGGYPLPRPQRPTPGGCFCPVQVRGGYCRVSCPAVILTCCDPALHPRRSAMTTCAPQPGCCALRSCGGFWTATPASSARCLTSHGAHSAA
jgi:hypothetical protein